MKERPILFSAPMVRAILDGRKTQTRRVAKAANRFDLSYAVEVGAGLWGDEEGEMEMRCPYGHPGDRLWVREAWGDVNLEGAPGIAYRADDDIRDLMAEPGFHDEDGAFNYDDERVKPYDFAVWSEDLISGVEGRWRPSIHMPRWACRLVLEVTGVRVERLQDISESDALAEGLDHVADGAAAFGIYGLPRTWNNDPRISYSRLWESINGPGSWDANPWVWVVEFKRIEQPATGEG